MAYGIEITSANGNLQLSSDSPNIGFIVTDQVSSSSTVTYDPTKEIIFAKPASTSYTSQKVHLHAPTGYAYGSSATFTFEEDTNVGGASNATVNMNYIKGKWAEEMTAATSGYGVQIYSSNNDLAYDSTFYSGNGGFGITSFKNLNALTGNGTFSNSTNDPADALVTTDISSYVSFYPTTSVTPAEYEFYNVTTDPDAVKGIYWYSFFMMLLGSIPLFHKNNRPILIGEGGSV